LPFPLDAAARGWARAQAGRSGLEALGYFGSYARGDWGVGSDLDLVAILSRSDEPFERRPLAWDLTGLPVPAEILVYTRDEWARRLERGDRFARMLRDEVVWRVRDGRALA
jgi:predicted nucleotidyltransferase